MPRTVQVPVYKQGYNTARVLAGLDDAKENVCAALKKYFLDYTASAESRKHMAQLLNGFLITFRPEQAAPSDSLPTEVALAMQTKRRIPNAHENAQCRTKT